MIHYFVAAIIILFSAKVVMAETIRLDIKTAVVMALEKNHQLKAADSRTAAVRKNVAIAGAGYFPRLSFEESYTISNSPTQSFMMKLDQGRFTQNDFQINRLNSPGEDHNFRTALNARMPLYNPSLSPEGELARSESQLQEAYFENSRQETAFLVYKLYLNMMKASARVNAAEKALDEAGENLRLATVRSSAGTGLRSEELRAKTNLARSQQHLISTKNDLVITRMELGNAIGLSENEDIDIVQDDILPVYLPDSQVDLVVGGKFSRSEVKILTAELDKNSAAVNIAKSGYLPSVDLFASYQLDSRDKPFGSDGSSWNAGVAVTWHLFEGFKMRHELEKARASYSATRELLVHEQLEGALRIKQSLIRSDEMSRRYAVARSSLRDAEETVRLISRRYENSLATLVELLDAQTALNESRAELVESEANLHLARGYVYFSAGTFVKEITK